VRNECAVFVLAPLFHVDLDAGEAVALLDDDAGDVTRNVCGETDEVEALVRVAVDGFNDVRGGDLEQRREAIDDLVPFSSVEYVDALFEEKW